MVDDIDPYIPQNNIRSLLQVISQMLDDFLAQYRQGTRFESVRASDVRVFVAAYRQLRTVPEISTHLGISRQAVHKSIQRLTALKVLELQPDPQQSRRKLVVITDRGHAARVAARDQILRFEAEIAEIIGHEALESMRDSLVKLENAWANRAANAD
jgi:DNA-binding MarR family transcriptional regulator